MNDTHPKLFIATPSIGYVYTRPFHAITTAVSCGGRFWAKTHGWDAQYMMLATDRMPLAMSRNRLAQIALEMEADWVWWLDDDVGIPSDALERMWAHKDKAPIISVPISKKKIPSEVMVYCYQNGTSNRVVRPQWQGQSEADGVGMGCVLMRADVLKDVLLKRGGEPFHYAGGKFGTEELAFFEDCHLMGHKILIDSDIKVQHFGMHGFQAEGGPQEVNKSPYEGVDVVPEDFNGYFHPDCHEGIKALLAESPVRYAAEIGSYTGRSAVFMGESIKALGGKLFCVDPWEAYSQLPKQDNWPLVYRTFLSNMIHHGLQDTVVPIRTMSPGAATRFEDASLDLVYVDGLHTKDAVYKDIVAWWPKLKSGGVMCGDDICWPGVRDGVTEACAKVGTTIKAEAAHFWRLERKA